MGSGQPQAWYYISNDGDFAVLGPQTLEGMQACVAGGYLFYCAPSFDGAQPSSDDFRLCTEWSALSVATTSAAPPTATTRN